MHAIVTETPPPVASLRPGGAARARAARRGGAGEGPEQALGHVDRLRPGGSCDPRSRHGGAGTGARPAGRDRREDAPLPQWPLSHCPWQDSSGGDSTRASSGLVTSRHSRFGSSQTTSSSLKRSTRLFGRRPSSPNIPDWSNSGRSSRARRVLTVRPQVPRWCIGSTAIAMGSGDRWVELLLQR